MMVMVMTILMMPVEACDKISMGVKKVSVDDYATRTMKMKFNVQLLPRQNLIKVFRKSEVTRIGMFTTKEGEGDVLHPASVQVVIIIVLYFFYTALILLLYFMQYFHSIIASTKLGQGVFIS